MDSDLRQRFSLEAGLLALIEHPRDPALRFDTAGEFAAPAQRALEPSRDRQRAEAVEEPLPAVAGRGRWRGSRKLLALVTVLVALVAWAAIAVVGAGHASGPAAPRHAAPRSPRVTPLPILARAPSRLASQHAMGGVSHQAGQRPHASTESTGAHGPATAVPTGPHRLAASASTADTPVSAASVTTHGVHPRSSNADAPAPVHVDRHTPLTPPLPRPRSSTPIAPAPVGVGRHLPVASSLPRCGDALNGPPRDCRNLRGGFEAIADRGTPLHLRTLDARITSVRITPSLASGTMTAPPGISFILIGATITNRTATPQLFEPAAETVPGRQTGLWIYDRSHHTLAYHGPDGADYSVEVLAALKGLSRPLAGATLRPGVPYHGQLVFAYPDTELQRGAVAVLDIQEFGEGYAGLWSIGGFRIRL